MSMLERHAYFYPHTDQQQGGPVQGHAQAAEAGIQTIYRRLYHNPNGYQRPDEYDFVTYFECADEHLRRSTSFDRPCETNAVIPNGGLSSKVLNGGADGSFAGKDPIRNSLTILAVEAPVRQGVRSDLVPQK